MLYDAEIMLGFIEEIAEYLPQLRQHLTKLATNPKNKDALEEAYRLSHTIKGSAAMLELEELSAEGRTFEQALLPAVEKKAPLTPEIANRLLGRVDIVETLLTKVKAEANGETVAPVAAPPPPPKAVEPPPVRVNQASLPPPPPPPISSPPAMRQAPPPPVPLPPTASAPAYNYEYTMPPPPPAPSAMRQTPPPVAPPDDFASFLPAAQFELPEKIPAPPPPAYFNNFQERDEDQDLDDIFAASAPPPPPPPPEVYRKAVTGEIPTPEAFDLDFDFAELEAIDTLAGLDLDETDLPPPPPPMHLYELKQRGSSVFDEGLSPVAEPSRSAPAFKSYKPPVTEKPIEFGNFSPPPVMPASPDVAPFSPSVQSVAAPSPIPAPAPPSKFSGADLGLMDFLLDDTPPDLLGQGDLPTAQAQVGPGIQPSNEAYKAYTPSFDSMPFSNRPFELPDFGSEAATAPESEAGGLDDIWAGDQVDLNVTQLQSEILAELPPQLENFDRLPMPGEIAVSDADLLTAIPDDLTGSPVPYLPGLDNGNSLQAGHLDFDLKPPPPEVLQNLPTTDTDAEELHDFTDAANLLAEFELDSPFDEVTQKPEALATNPPSIDFEPASPVGLDEEAALFRAEWSSKAQTAPLEAVLPDLSEPTSAPLDDKESKLAANLSGLSGISNIGEDFSLSDFEALADSLDAVGEDEEASRLAGLASLRGLPSLEERETQRLKTEAAQQVAAEALSKADELEAEDAAIQAAVAAMQKEADDLPDEFSDEEMSEAGLDVDDIQMGAFFLAEGQADIDQLKELVAEYDQPDTDKEATARKIGEICGTLRKASQMMDLNGVSRQLSVMENTSELVGSGELAADAQTGMLFHESLTELLSLLAPFEEAAANLFALPEAGTESKDDSDEETSDEQELEAAEAAPMLIGMSDAPPTQPLSPRPYMPPPPPKIQSGDLDPELAEVFTSEAEEHIQNLDARLAQLERDPNNRELIREIRRTAHTLKGSAAMVGFNVVSQTGHLMEDLLDRLFDGSVTVTPEVVELLFTTFNAMDIMVRGLASGVPEDPAILDDLRPAYAALLSGEDPEEAATGGMFIFERKAATGPLVATQVEAQPSARPVDEAEMMALEAAIAAAEQDADDTTLPSMRVSGPQPVAPTRPSTPTSSATPQATDLSVKVDIKRLDIMMNQIGEMVINRTVLERRNQILARSVDELLLSIKRLQRVTRELETRYEVELLKNSALPVGSAAVLEPETEFSSGNGNGNGNYNGYSNGRRSETTLPNEPDRLSEFDTLEMDRYTEFHTLSREMTETVDDLDAAWRELDTLKGDLENAVLQQARLTDDLQDRVVKVRLVPVSNLTPRLYRTVRTVAAQQQKEIEFVVSGEQTQIDKTIFEELGDPLLHLVRNAVDHGIEMPDVREAAGKPRTATIIFAARSEGSQVVIEVRDDGRGMNLDAIRQKGIERGLLAAEAQPSDEELYDLLFIPGFSTASAITDISGRGVGLDVVRANIARLKGTVEISSQVGKGTTFFIRLPSTLAITRALLVKVSNFTYAIPLSAIERTVRGDPALIESYSQRNYYRLEDSTLPLLDLGQLLHLQPAQRRAGGEDEDEATRNQFAIRRERPLLVINGPERAVLQVDSLVGQQEVVAKSLGSHLKSVAGITGATILGTGEVILILNAYELISTAIGRRGRYSTAVRPTQTAPETLRRGTTGTLGAATPRKRVPLIQVVDDSLSVRKVLTSALEKAGFRVRTSKDGQEAYEMIQQVQPDLILMDIEMPRMDGYELTALLKGRETFRNIPVVMLTSRGGLKHRQKAEEVGADGFLVKPYREDELLQAVSALLIRARQ